MKVIFALTAATGLHTLASTDTWPSQIVTCQKEESGSKVVMQIFEKDRGSKVKKNKLISLKVGNFSFDDGPIECKDAFRAGGNSGDYCDLGDGYTAHIHPNSYSPYSGFALYKDMRSIEEDKGLECDF